jgi:hypothetical protein
MEDDTEMKSAFLNRRDWGSYLSALESAASYPKVLETKFLEALKSGRVWVSAGATEASSWLVGKTDLRDKFSTG